MRPLGESWAASMLCIVLALFIGFQPLASAAPQPISEAYTSYQEIPGVTEQDIAAIEALKKEYGSFSYGMIMSNECFMQQDSVYGGFAALFAKRLGALFGIDFNIRLRDWNALSAELLDGRIHFSGDDIGAYLQRNTTVLHTSAIAKRVIKQISLYNNASLATLAVDRPLRYVFLEHSAIPELVESYLTKPHEIIRAADAEQAFYMLSHGESDVFIDDSTIEAVLTPEYELLISDFSPLLYNDVSLIACMDKFSPVISVVQKYLDADGGAEVRDLYAQGWQAYLQHKLWGQLTEPERAYLRLHQNPVAVIPMTIAYDNYPVSFYNVQDNEWQGIALDIIRKIEDLTGMTFVCVNKRNDSFSTILERLENDQVAITLDLIRTPERENRFIWSDPPYLTDYYTFLSKTDYPDINLAQVKNARVGVIKSTAYAETFDEMFPNHPNITYFENVDEAFDSIDRDDIDMILATRNHLLYATSYMERVGYKENIVLDKVYSSCFGFSRNEAVLCSIVGKALRLIDTRQINDKWIRRVFDYRGKLARAQVPVLIVSSVLLMGALSVVVVLLFKNRKTGRELEKTVDMRTAQLLERTKDLELQTEMAQAGTRAKSDFLARMSHEIRTPLNAIIGMTEIAKKTSAEPKTVQSLESVTIASAHLLGILNDILDMSKIEAGKFMLSEEAFDFREAMCEVAEIIAQRCDEKDISFVRDFQLPECIGAYGDKLRLKQVLINLLGNAVKFTPVGGIITMTVHGHIQADDNFHIQFRVTDTGIGISEDQQQRLFTAFEQAHTGIAQKYGGTGLGLAISQHLVHLLGGEITVDSTLGKGSTFSFSVSLPQAEISASDARTPEIPRLEGRRILLAEDVEINRIIVSEILMDTKVEIEEAADGTEAVQRFTDSPPEYYDLIFMDIQMPNLNGYDATREIRALDRADAKEIPIIAMTANAYKEDVDLAIEAGMNAHLPKPIDIVQVIETLAKYIK